MEPRPCPRKLAVAASAALLALGLGTPAAAQGSVMPIPLDYNFNGIVHVGEAGMPDDPNGFRGISDRALDFRNGVPADPLLDAYELVDQPGVLDLVHLGNRDTVAGGAHKFDASVDGDDVGVLPAWLAGADQSGPQTTVLNPPLVLPTGKSLSFSFLYHISNGGGGFELLLDFDTGFDIPLPVTGPDWFGGDYPGTGGVDRGNPDGNLNVQEFRVPLNAYAGRTLLAITFQNPDNANAGYAIFAANLTIADIASNTLRTAGSNPASYTARTNPILGSTYMGEVDLAGTTGHDFALLVGFVAGTDLALPNGLHVLVDPLHPGGELLGLGVEPGPVAEFELALPGDLAFSGFTLTTQAVHAGGAVGGYSLSNAYDHVLGL